MQGSTIFESTWYTSSKIFFLKKQTKVKSIQRSLARWRGRVKSVLSRKKREARNVPVDLTYPRAILLIPLTNGRI